MRARRKLSPVLEIFLAALTLVGFALPAAAQRGAITRPRNLAQLVEQAAVIARGHVVSAKVEPHPDLAHLMTVVVTLRVQETLKGPAQPTVTFRQYIWDLRDRYDAAGYSKGLEVLLLLNPPTRYGLSSPAGLEQGRFRILRDPQGQPFAANGQGNAGLFRDLEAHLTRKGIRLPARLAAMVQEHRAGPIALDDLKELIQQFVTLRAL